MSQTNTPEAETPEIVFHVGDLVHTDIDEEIGMVRYVYMTRDQITVEYTSQRGPMTYTEEWEPARLRLHARPIYATVEAKKRGADALHAIAQRDGFGCPPSWTAPWRDWYVKIIDELVDALVEPDAEGVR